MGFNDLLWFIVRRREKFFPHLVALIVWQKAEMPIKNLAGIVALYLVACRVDGATGPVKEKEREDQVNRSSFSDFIGLSGFGWDTVVPNTSLYNHLGSATSPKELNDAIISAIGHSGGKVHYIYLVFEPTFF